MALPGGAIHWASGVKQAAIRAEQRQLREEKKRGEANAEAVAEVTGDAARAATAGIESASQAAEVVVDLFERRESLVPNAAAMAP